MESLSLLKQWCDALLACRVTLPHPRLRGALLCPACQVVHGRCGELVYPLLCLADHTGAPKYTDAARQLFTWSESLVCDDGSIYNDGQSAWRGITVFAALSLREALHRHGQLLPEAERAAWQTRLLAHGEWIHRNIRAGFESNINYYAAGAGALAVLGRDYDRPDWSAHADELAQFCLVRISPEGLFCGEGKPIDAVTAKGCRPVDIGYNLEESLPGLLQYARARENAGVLARIHELFQVHAAFLLPDGGMDNSFGTRNFKWTYWGSRTSEGGAYAMAWLGQTDPALQSAAARELALWGKSTHSGLLMGGPDYAKLGQPACIHHTISHAKALAELIDDGLVPQDTAPLPRETSAPLTAYPTLDTYLVHVGDWMATVTGYDFRYLKGGHATGGTLSLLYHQKSGVLAASAMTRYSLYEAHNMQQSGALAAQGSLTPRLQSGCFASCLDESAVLHAEETDGTVEITVQGHLRDEDQNPAAPYRFVYRFAQDGVRLTAEVAADEAKLILPLTEVAAVRGAEKSRPVFSLAGGFAMTEYRASVRAGSPVTVCIGYR